MPKRETPPALGKLELKIMQALWKKQPATARQITEAVNVGAGRAVAHSTVQTLLRKMEAKNAITHEEQERVFLFRARFAEEEVTASATADLLGRVFGGSATALVAHLLRREDVSEAERARLRALISETDDATGDEK